MLKGRVHSIETFGTVDGPGIRYIIFFQGCPLRCKYCHNRDTWKTNCGKEYTVDELAQDIMKYQTYMQFSGGGVTASGGEATLQAEFVTELFAKCKELGIHTCLDTAGFVDIEKVDKLLDYTDLVLLDIHLPFFDGYYWCQEIRKISQVPIVFISSANENMNIVLAMNMGGDDFINKPFDLQVVQAKLQAILRRTYSFSKDFHLLTYQDVHLDILAGKITYQQKELILTKNELKILEYLFEHAEVIVSRIDLMNHLWDDHQFIDDNTLSVNMNRLRKKLEDIGLHDFIHTKKGLGYLLCLKTI